MLFLNIEDENMEVDLPAAKQASEACDRKMLLLAYGFIILLLASLALVWYFSFEKPSIQAILAVFAANIAYMLLSTAVFSTLRP